MKNITLIFALAILAGANLCASWTFAGDRPQNTNNTLNVTIIKGQVITNGLDAKSTIEGSGNAARTEREIPEFRTIVLNIGAKVRIRPAETSNLSLTADDNLLPVISTEVRDQALIISARQPFSTRNPILIEVGTPALSGATVNGSGSLELQGLPHEQLSLNLSGSGAIAATGAAERLSATLNGSGRLDLQNLAVQNAHAFINGSGRALLAVKENLTLRINGSGQVVLYGEPQKVQSKIYGSGAVTRAQ